LGTAWAQRVVHLVVPFGPGAVQDTLARTFNNELGQALGATVLVENRAGAGGTVGTAQVAHAASDGNTLVLAAASHNLAGHLYAKLPYDTMRDLTPVIEVAEVPNVITVPASLPISTLRELVDLAKKEPDRFNYGTPGAGSSGHLSAELLSVKSGAKFTHVPYQGNAQATNDHLGGVLQVGFINLPVGLQFVKAGRLKALAVTTVTRTREELAAVFKELDGDWLLLAKLGYGTGLRLMELLRLRVKELDFGNCMIIVKDGIINATRTSTYRISRR
jgi:tripartite-type tricarboxylate transporter receptor subunit TctC